MKKIYSVNNKLLKNLSIIIVTVYSMLFFGHIMGVVTYYLPEYISNREIDVVAIYYTIITVLNEVAALYLILKHSKFRNDKKSKVTVHLLATVFSITIIILFGIILEGNPIGLVFFIPLSVLVVLLFLSAKCNYEELSPKENIRAKKIKVAGVFAVFAFVFDIYLISLDILYIYNLLCYSSFSLDPSFINFLQLFTEDFSLFCLIIAGILIIATSYFNLFFGIKLIKNSAKFAFDNEFIKHKKFFKIIGTVMIISAPIIPPYLILSSLRNCPKPVITKTDN